ncbi:MAG: hypothetical protein GY796_34055 [Chloroflexi bacterium]|nr:hypothetical protein [Chloroflexota bacterium]
MTQKTTGQRGGCLSSLVNVMAALLILAALLMVGAICFVALGPGANTVYEPVAQFLAPSAEDVDISQVEGPGLPTLVPAAEIPSPTPTAEFPTLAPTWTPLPDLPTSTPIPFTTSKPTVTPSIQATLPTYTPTPTPTNTPTNTPTATPTGPTPTPSPTRSQFIFTKTDNSPFYLQNHANSAGCRWMGIAGEILDLDRNPVAAGSYVVHVWGSGVDERVSAGSAPAYGLSGWEQFLFDSPTVRDYNVQLESPNGTPVSQVYQVQSHGSCNENLVQINFAQNH